MSTRSIFLLILAALTFIWASEGVAGVPFQAIPCICETFKRLPPIPNIQQCYEQQSRHKCLNHGFVLRTENGDYFCADKTSRWITKRIKGGLLTCPTEISLSH